MIVNTLEANSLEQLQARLAVASQANSLILAFASSDIDHSALYELISQKGYIAVTASSAGQFVNGTLLYYGITCMILVLPENSFTLERYDYSDDFFAAGHALGKLAQTVYQDADALMLINATPYTDHEAILEGFHQGAKQQVNVFGSLASNSLQAADNFIGINGKVSQQAIAMIVFDKSKVALQGVVVGGWEPIGTYKTVTKSLGKKVYELDNRPVQEIYKEYFDHTEGSPVSKYLEFPIQISSRDGGTILRSISAIEEDGFCYSGHIAEGTKVYFCSPSITKTVSSSINEINNFQQRNELMDSDAVVAFSCSARLYSFGFYIQNELRSFNEMWGAKHTGFFGHGEIGSIHNEEAKLHNNSISVLFIKDLTTAHSPLTHSHNIHYREHKIEIADVLDKNIVIAKLQEQKLALTNLLQRTSFDLNAALRQLDQYKDDLEHKVEEQLADIKKLNKDIIDTQKEVIFTMGSIAETRSKETGNHVRRVAEYSKTFALLIGLGEEKAELLKQASPMHDIGKVGIPDAILNKPGKLTVGEFEEMKTHAELGYKMLCHSQRPILQVAATIAHEHHERWDGYGYPRGLAGEEIHIYGRITAIADVFDALGSQRCYKEPWSDQAIWHFFKEQQGKHFDPTLVSLFFEHLSVFKAIRQQYRDLLE